MKKVYISGKITGLPRDEVIAKFSTAKEDLKKQGYEVISPVENGLPCNASYESHIILDIVLLIGCDAIYMLSDWEYSEGATLEHNIAEKTGKEIIYQDTPVFMELKKAIKQVMNIDFYNIASKSRNALFVFARIIFSYYCTEEGIEIIKIANHINRNRATVIYYLHKYSDYYRFTIEFRVFADEISKLIKNKRRND
ncbi:MAG: DUF4406 domain-containing protein [Prevotellaceae bacterium]|jgi:hypothetical protein|nr:DUF4406 domain-containing protein [Prevotellaceae bacterium]